MFKKFAPIFLVFLCLVAPKHILAQTEPDDIALNQDAFADSFYESLKQKGIENYDRAIIALQKCEKLEPNNATVFFEMGKNYLAMKDYPNAYTYFEKATQIDPKNKWFWVGLYDTTYETRDWNRAIPIVQKLITFKSDYREDLVSIYMNSQQFDKALALINTLNDEVGKTEMRDNYKAQILRDSRFQGSEKDNLLEQIKKNPKEEANYIALIYLFSESNQEEKALEIAKKLEKEIPTSDWAQVSLFKFYLNTNDGDKAVNAMNIVLPSKKIDDKIKHKILNEFLIHIKDKPQYDPALDKAISYFENDPQVDVAKEIANYYSRKSNWEKAEKYYRMDLASNPDDVEAMIFLCQTLVESKQFDKLLKEASDISEKFPLQPQFYYYLGLALNQNKNFKKAKEVLETGLDYVIEDKPLEINFYIQIGEAYSGLGKPAKKDEYFQKAEKILNQPKKK